MFVAQLLAKEFFTTAWHSHIVRSVHKKINCWPEFKTQTIQSLHFSFSSRVFPHSQYSTIE